jgi:hypothetical protein
VTEFGSATEVPEADRAEQAPASPALPDGGIPDDAPEADALEQGRSVGPEESAPELGVGDREADAGDVLEQETEVPVDDEDIVD